jgi:hypothetical protein
MPSGGDREKKSFEEMLGETLREVGVLVGVFGIFDVVMRDKDRSVWDLAVGSSIVAVLFLAFTGLGMFVEIRRRR